MLAQGRHHRSEMAAVSLLSYDRLVTICAAMPRQPIIGTGSGDGILDARSPEGAAQRLEHVVETPIYVERGREAHEARNLRRAECIGEAKAKKESVPGLEVVQSHFEGFDLLCCNELGLRIGRLRVGQLLQLVLARHEHGQIPSALAAKLVIHTPPE